MKLDVRDIDVKGKRVLVRCDFNVPLKNGKITDDFRIKSSLETINYLINHGAKVILMSHLGRPKGEYKEEFSLLPVKERLEKFLGQKVGFLSTPDVVNEEVREMANSLHNGEVMLLENTRFVAGEEKNDPTFGAELASLGEYYVNDAFGTAHRAHCSNVGVGSLLPSVSGFLLAKEIKHLGDALENPERPFIAILGGAKVSDKITVIEHLLDKVDILLIGGAMANTFLGAKGNAMGKSLVEEDAFTVARDLMKKAEDRSVRLVLPVDLLVTKDIEKQIGVTNVDVSHVPEDAMAVDIGEKTLELFSSEIEKGKTIVWNGPMGIFEIPAYSKGTFGVAKAMAATQGVTIIGGGDSAHAIKLSGYEEEVSHVSTGGGASLEMMEGKRLPGIEILKDKESHA
ncbi:MAG: phosphoglycerate kinase [Tissierellia bacterium]|nr:phosphoglycerate kinase [Tissierellia bacterium]